MLLAWALLPVVGNAIYWFHATRMLYEAAPAWIAFATLAAVELGRGDPNDTALASRLRAVAAWTFVAALLAAPVWGIPTRWSTYSWTDETLARIVLPELPGGGPAIVNYITGYRRYIRQGGGGNYRWSIPWLGDLYADSVYVTQWHATDLAGNIRGNMLSGTASTRFYRAQDQSTYSGSNFRAWGTSMLDAEQRTSTRGCVTMFNIGNSSSHFNHHFNSGTGNLVGAGIELATNYAFPIPSSATINRPFSVNTGGNVPTEYNYAPYSTNRYSGSILVTYYDHPSGNTGSGLVTRRQNFKSYAAVWSVRSWEGPGTGG